MTDHSTARALVEGLRYVATILDANADKFAVPDHIPAKARRVRQAADFIEQSITPPEGDIRALVMGKIDASERAMIKERKAQYGSRFNREQEENIKASHRQRRIGAEIALEALTPPEGDALSVEKAIAHLEDGWPLDADQRADVVRWLKSFAALQSSVSPHEGLREALEELRSEVIRGFGLINPESKLGKALTKSDAALSAGDTTSGEVELPVGVRRVVHELRLSMQVFRDYGYQHQDKAEAATDPRERAERERKAKRNFERAAACEDALDLFEAGQSAALQSRPTLSGEASHDELAERLWAAIRDCRRKGESVVTLNFDTAMKAAMLLQSRVSPQEELKKVLEDARNNILSLLGGFRDDIPDVVVKLLQAQAQRIDVVLAASRMSEDANNVNRK